MIQTVTQRAAVNFQSGRPVRQTKGFTLKCDHSSAGAIKDLLSASSPYTVAWRVTFRVIDSFYCVLAAWLASHVVVEVFKRIPSLAYCNSLCSIAMEIFAILFIAALVHVVPRSVLRCLGHSVYSFGTWNATFAAIAFKVASADGFFYPAIESTVPVDCFRWIACISTENRPFTKSLPSQVYKVVGATIRIAVSHDFVPQKQVVVRTASQLQLIGCSHFSSLSLRGQR